MSYYILYEHNNWGKVLTRTEKYEDAMNHFSYWYNTVKKLKKSELDVFYVFEKILYSYKIDNHRNWILDSLHKEITEDYSIYIVECCEDFNHNNFKRKYSSYYSEKLKTINGVIHIETHLN